MIALDNDFFLFYAQFFYALSAPLLFSRLLMLAQIYATLGPMTQVGIHGFVVVVFSRTGGCQNLNMVGYWALA